MISNIKRLDLSYNSNLPPELTDLYNKIAKKTRLDYTNLIDNVSASNLDNMSWWYSAPASRDIYRTNIFHYCCCIRILKKLIKNKCTIDKIIIDNKYFAKAIYKLCKDNNIKLLVNKKTKYKDYILPLYAFILSLYHKFCVWIINRKPSIANNKQSFVIIDTFLIPGYENKDRYFTGMYNFLNSNERKRIIIVPNYSNLTFYNSFTFFLQIRKSSFSFILKENILKLSDYFNAFIKSLIPCKISVKKNLFENIDVSNLILQETHKINHFSNLYESHLKYLLIKKLSKKKYSFEKIISWFENQPHNKACSKAVSDFLPNVHHIGYQGFFREEYLFCKQPTLMETKAKVIPKQIGVMGNGPMLDIKEFNTKLKVNIAPAFRFSYIHKRDNLNPPSKKNKILVGLPIFHDLARDIIDKLLICNDNKKIKNIHFMIKLHPACNPNKIFKAEEKLPNNFSLVDGNFNYYIEKSNLLISSASAVCMETIALGIPVIIIENRNGLSENPISPQINSTIYKKCSNSNEILNAILFFRNITKEQCIQYSKDAEWIKKNFFTKPTRKNTLEFLGLETLNINKKINNQ